MHLVAAHKTNGLSFYQPLWSKQMYNCLFWDDCWNFSHFSRIFSYKSGLFLLSLQPYNIVQSTKDSPSIRNDFSASPPPQKNGKYFLLSSREASHYQEHFSKWASSGINVHFSSFYILSITADSIWKVNSGEVNMDFKLYKSVICTNNASSTNQAKICLVLFSILNFIRVMHQKMFL